jgi:hypothetical protein
MRNTLAFDQEVHDRYGVSADLTNRIPGLYIAVIAIERQKVSCKFIIDK